MITVNYGLILRIKGIKKGQSKKRQSKKCQGLRLDLKATQHKKIREVLRAKHPGWILESFEIVDNKVDGKMKKKKMLLFTCIDHDCVQPTGVASIVFAENRTQAYDLLNKALIAEGLAPNAEPLYTLQLVGISKARAIILCNGDY